MQSWSFDCLEEIANGNLKNISDHLGICSNTELHYLVEHVAPQWEFFSGNVHFPVPDPKYPKDVWMAEWIYYDTIDKYEGEYGNLRIDLSKFIFEWVVKNGRQAAALIEEQGEMIYIDLY